jgi:uncharacterized repeat protein (TIGR01451 family)
LYSNLASDLPGQGRSFVGTTTVTTDSSGNGTFTANTNSVIPIGDTITATDTDSNGNTSQFSNNLANNNPIADLAITGTSAPNPVAAGGFFTFTFTIVNNGPNQGTNVSFTDTLPTSLNFVMATSSTGSVTQSAGTVTATLGTLNAGATATVTIQVTSLTTTTGTISNTGTVSATEDTNLANNSATVQTTVQPGVDWTVTSSVNPNPAVVGKNTVLTYTLTNTGQATATTVVFTTQLPSGLTFGSATSTPGTVSQANGLVTAQVGTLAPGASAQVAIAVVPTTTGSFTTTSNVTADQLEVNPPDSSSSFTFTVNSSSTPPANTDGPVVTSLTRVGVHNQQTDILVAFNKPLNITTAQNTTNYTLTIPAGKHGRKRQVIAANYNSVNNTVELVPPTRINLRTRVTLTINGTTSTGVADTNGNLLDGARTGKPGSDFVRTFSGFGPGPIS